MSSLDKLGIQGIRSFGPDNLCKIDFFSPLTLILGQNGCGKTTIIESLKFVTTGEFPPGCGKNCATFIHDPKIAKDPIVRAQVKLRFKSIKNQIITGCRSVEAVQKKKNTQFGTLESTLEYNTPEGKKRVSSKCLDFHMEMTSLLGVVKPILENVIFCHQEDSNWPLDEGKKVKEKFDSIFNATKYIKCLESIRKLHKEKKQHSKILLGTLQGLKGMKEQARLFRNELQETQNTNQDLMEEREKLESEKGPIKKRLHAVDEILRNIFSLNSDISGKEHQLKSIRQMQDHLRTLQNEIYTCSDTELLNLISEFEHNLKMQLKKCEELEFRLSKVNGDIETLKKKESRALLFMGKLEAAQKTQFDNIKKRNRLLEELVTKYNILGFEDRDDFDLNESGDILKRMDERLQEEREKTMKKKREFERQETDLQKEIDNMRSKELSLEHDITSLSKRIADNSKKSRVLRQTLMTNEDDLASLNLEELKRSLEEIDRKIKEEETRVDVPKLKRESDNKKEEKEKLERQLDDVKRKVIRMNRQAEARSQYDIHVKEKNSLQQKNQQLKRRNEDDFASIFNGPVSDNIKNEFEAQLSSVRKLKAQEEEKKLPFERQKTELRLKIENEKVAIDKIENEIKGFESKLEDLCGRKDLDDATHKVKDEIDQLRKTIGDHESSIVLFRGFMEKIRAGEACPLCHRDFEEGYEELLVEEIERKLRRLPDELSKRQKELKMKDELHNKLVQLKPRKDAADKLASELEAERSKLKKYYKDLEKVSTDLDSSSDRFSYLVSEEETCNRVLPDVLSIDSNLRSIRQHTEKISNIQAALGTTDDDLSMDELMKLQSGVELKVKNFQKEIEADQTEIMEHTNQLQRLNSRKLHLSTQEFESKKKQQDTEKLKEEVAKLKEETSELEERKEVCMVEIAPVRVQLKEKRDSRMNVVRQKENVIEGDNKKIEMIRDEKRGALDVHKVTLAYVEERRDTALAEGKQELFRLQEETKAQEAEKKNQQEKLNRVNKELTTHKERKRSLDSEKEVRDKDIEAKLLEKNIAALNEKVKDSDHNKMVEERQTLLMKEKRVSTRLATLEGKLEGVRTRIRDLERSLNRKDIKQAEKNYKDMTVDMKCTDIACDDLNKYYKALDTAIMRFHQEKMNTINNIIRELWRSTYRGNDIDYIEIKTDDETESQGADKRRTYHYRVVMVKNEVEMDMRGRCSAGQKVLASLIIRMALAETFSMNCGVLALDEPTTNLDRDNIEALSLALLNIVNKRSHQKNFQLIVITHDNEFLERLTRADYIEHYYEVSRNARGLSVITKHATH